MTRGSQPLRPTPLSEVHLLPNFSFSQFLPPAIVINGCLVVYPLSGHSAPSANPTPLQCQTNRSQQQLDILNQSEIANQRGKMTIHTKSSDNSIMSFLSQFLELHAKRNISSVSLFSPNSPKTILIMSTPKPTGDESKKEQLLEVLEYNDRLVQKRLQIAANKKAELEDSQKESEKAKQEAQDVANAAA
jgi:hypothetical protein